MLVTETKHLLMQEDSSSAIKTKGLMNHSSNVAGYFSLPEEPCPASVFQD